MDMKGELPEKLMLLNFCIAPLGFSSAESVCSGHCDLSKALDFLGKDQIYPVILEVLIK